MTYNNTPKVAKNEGVLKNWFSNMRKTYICKNLLYILNTKV